MCRTGWRVGSGGRVTAGPCAQALLDIASDKVDRRRSLDKAFYDHCFPSNSSGSTAASTQLALRAKRAQSMEAGRAGSGSLGSGPGCGQPLACLAAQASPQRVSSEYSSASSASFPSEDGRLSSDRGSLDRSPRGPAQRVAPDPTLSSAVAATGESPRTGQKRWAVFRRSTDVPPMPAPAPAPPRAPSCTGGPPALCGPSTAGGSLAARAGAGGCASSAGCCAGGGKPAAGCAPAGMQRDPHGAVPLVQADAMLRLAALLEGVKAPPCPPSPWVTGGPPSGPPGCCSSRGRGAGAAPAGPAGLAPGARPVDHLVTLDSAREMPLASLRHSADARGAAPAAPAPARLRIIKRPPLPLSTYMPATLSDPGSGQVAELAPDTPPGTPLPAGKPPAKGSPDSSVSGGAPEAAAGPYEPPRSKVRSAGDAPKRKGCRVSFSVAPGDEPGGCARAGEQRAAGDCRCVSTSSPAGAHPASPFAGMDCAFGPTPDGF